MPRGNCNHHLQNGHLQTGVSNWDILKCLVSYVLNLTLKRVGGWKVPTATLRACRVVCDEGGGMKPSCNFHFGCLKQVDNINFGGCL